jgi:hypothetical protein
MLSLCKIICGERKIDEAGLRNNKNERALMIINNIIIINININNNIIKSTTTSSTTNTETKSNEADFPKDSKSPSLHSCLSLSRVEC